MKTLKLTLKTIKCFFGRHDWPKEPATHNAVRKCSCCTQKQKAVVIDFSHLSTPLTLYSWPS